jgi:NAD+ kinase
MYRPQTPAALAKAKELAKFLVKKGLIPHACPRQDLGSGYAKIPSASSKLLDQIDWMIVLGGDGTYLQAVTLLGGRRIPILGINMGSLGFLTDIRMDEMIPAVEQALLGKMHLHSRSTLKVEVRTEGKLRSTHVALNDAVIERGSTTHLINIEVHSGKNLVGDIKADALIISSPTGSTAYNLAAGGPILHPEVRAIVVTPVCPHALTSRPLIFPDDQKLSFKPLSRDRKAVLTIDGVNCGELTTKDEVVIVRHTAEHILMRKPDHNFFGLLREKLKFGERN